jgi:pimeloyl-ACP methyl ester carboxylesterase
VPRARLVLVPKAGHEFFLDRPRESAREIERFLRER